MSRIVIEIQNGKVVSSSTPDPELIGVEILVVDHDEWGDVTVTDEDGYDDDVECYGLTTVDADDDEEDITDCSDLELVEDDEDEDLED